MSFRHSFEIVVDITAGTEADHFATVTGTFFRARPAYTPRGEYAPIDPPEPASFEIESVVIEIGGKKLDFIPFLTEAQLSQIAEEGINDVSCLPMGRQAAE